MSPDLRAPVLDRAGWPGVTPCDEIDERMSAALTLVHPDRGAFSRTPVLLLDPSVAVAAQEKLQALLGVDVLYAVKANPHPALLRALAAAECGFDVASLPEVHLALAAGADPSRLSFGHPVKPRAAVAAAYEQGVRVFAADSPAEIDKIAASAPGSQAAIRLTVAQDGADWPLAFKYGTAGDEALALVERAARAGLAPCGVTFHVGSQQRLAVRFGQAVEVAVSLAWRAEAVGLPFASVNLGGGWPARLTADDPAVEQAAAAALDAARSLPPGVALLCEPGRHLAAPAGVLVASVISTVDRADGRWAYLDAGIFNGLIEAEAEIVRYPLATTAHGPLVPTVLAGPTCDSADILYRETRPLLPASLGEDDLVAFGGAGAYTTSYASVGFNGFAPLETEVVSFAGSSSTLPIA